jgi:hypothetical protein
MYGLTNEIRDNVKRKIRKQEIFLTTHCFNKGTNNIRMIDVIKTPIFNSKRYVSEVNHRVYNLSQYATSKNLKNIFGTITLPSEYHSFKTLKNGKTIPNPKYKNYTPNEGAKELSKMFKSLIDLRIYRDINKSEKCYFRVYEPHKDGTPHLHFSMFVPADKITDIVERFNSYMKENYQGLQVNFQTNINNPVSYLMKYILKTFDDLRNEKNKITDLSLWYVANNITRFYTSRTLISLDIYRKLTGKYSLLQLTRMYKDREITVFIDPDTKKVCSIYDNIGEIWKKPNYTVKEVTENTKFINKLENVPEIVRLSYCDIVDNYYTDAKGNTIENQKIDFFYDEMRNIKNIGFLKEYGFSA